MVIGSSLVPHMSLLMLLIDSTGAIVHLHGLTESEKASCESRPGHLYPYAWCLRIMQECSFNVTYKLDFNSCAIWNSFTNPVTYICIHI